MQRRFGVAGLGLAAAAALAAAGMSVAFTGGAGTHWSQTAGVSKPAQSNGAPAAAQDVAFVNWWRMHRHSGGRRTGPGWTQRQVQRMARKKRNQARHRRACRG